MDRLYATLRQRVRPEEVAGLLVELYEGQWGGRDLALLERTARPAQKWCGYSSMPSTFHQPVGLSRQVGKATQLFVGVGLPPNPEDSEAVASYIDALGHSIGSEPGAVDFKTQRLTRGQRREAGLEVSRRRYNKLFRHVRRMERKLGTFNREILKAHLVAISKSSLATELTCEEFSVDPDAAAFIAYYTACCNRRSAFVVGSQQRAFDKVSSRLLERCKDKGDGDFWWSIAHVYPADSVLQHLSDGQKGQLLGRWFELMGTIAGELRTLWHANQFQRNMVVQLGNDSTTWNQMAGAWNRARDHWMALTYSLGLREELETFCPGKVPRLMAYDVARAHQRSGGHLHYDLDIFSALPAPWEVFSGLAICKVADIDQVCLERGVDPEATGWTTPRPRTRVASVRPTPELVHGVSVYSPFLARYLRGQKAFVGGTPRRLGICYVGKNLAYDPETRCYFRRDRSQELST